jgi:biotin carboxyl carrier protein
MTLVRVTIDGEEFQVEVGDLQARPIVATIDGQRIEVWPSPALCGPLTAAPVTAPAPGRAAPPAGAVLAPLPGVIVEVSVRPGDRVIPGQPLVTIEAMKMKNVVRAVRAGQVVAVRVAVGETVKHRTPLLELLP